MPLPDEPDVLRTTGGDLALELVELQVAERTWSLLHTGAVIGRDDENAYLKGVGPTRPYGVLLWPSAIAIAHELATRELKGTRVLELGAGTGLPGIVAASLGAHVVQTDYQTLVMHVCQRNAKRNGVPEIDHRVADWTAWDDVAHYDLIIGADILYADALHPHLRRIFDTNLAAGGTVLLGDPFREASLQLLGAMEADGWRVTMDKWTVGLAPPPRPVGVFALTRREASRGQP